MNEKALEYAFGLFQQDGYTGTLDEYKELIGKDQEALDYSFDLFSNDGYSGNKDQFSALVMPGKTEPIAPGVAVEETAAPETVSTELQSEAGSSESRENLFENQALQFISDKIGSLGVGAAGILEGVGDFIEMPIDVATSKAIDIYNYFAENDITTQEKTFIRQKIDDIFVFDELFGAVGDQFEKMKTVRDDQSILDRIQNKDYAAAIDQTISGVFQGVPSVIASLSGIGLGILGTSAAGASYEELSEERPDAVGVKMAANSLVQGTVELFSERFTRGLFNSTAKAFGGGKVGAAKAGTILAKNMFFEGASETAAQEFNNVLDTTFKLNRFRDQDGNFDGRALLERTFDTFLVSSLIGGGTTVAGGVAGRQRELMYERLTPKEYKEKFLELSKAIEKGKAQNKSQQSSGAIFEDNTKNIEKAETFLTDLKSRVKTVYDTYTNSELADMVKLRSEISEIQAEIRNLPLSESEVKDRNKRIDQREKTIQDTFTEKYKVLRDKNIAATESLMQSLNFATKIEFNNEIDAKGEFVGGGTILVNQKLADQTLDFAVGSHELLHPILNALVGDANAQSQLRSQFEAQLTKKQKDWVQNSLDRAVPVEEHDTEYINVFSDGVARGEIAYVDGTFNKIGHFLKSLFRRNGFKNIDFNSGKGIYEFIGAYSKGLKAGKFNQGFVSTIKQREAETNIKVADVGTAGEMAQKSRSDVASLLSKYNGPRDMIGRTLTPTDTDFSDYRTSEFGKEIMPIVETITKRLFDKIPADATRVINENRNEARKEYQNALITEGATIVSNEFKTESLGEGQTIDNFISNRLNLRANDLAKRLGVQETIVQSLDTVSDEGPAIQIESNYIESTTMVDIRKAEADRLENLLDPTDVLPEDKAKLYYAIASEKVANGDFKNAVLATTEDVAPEITSELFGMKLNAYLGVNKEGKKTSVNFSGDKTKAQQLIYDNADFYITILPKGAILEGDAASKELIGTGVRIPRKLQQAFYNQKERLGIGAGLEPFELKPNITKKDFLDAFGINTDGTFQTLANGSPKAISMIGFARLIGRLMTNTAARAEMAKRVESGEYTLEEIQNYAAGKSESQKSEEPTIAEIIRILEQEAKQHNFENTQDVENVAKTYKGVVDSEIPDQDDTYDVDAVKNAGANNTVGDLNSGKQLFYKGQLLGSLEMSQKFLELMPAVLSSTLGLSKSAAMIHYRYGNYRFSIEKDRVKKLVIKDGDKFRKATEKEIEDFNTKYKNLDFNKAAETETTLELSETTKRYKSYLETLVGKTKKGKFKKIPVFHTKKTSDIKAELEKAANDQKEIEKVLNKYSNEKDNAIRVAAYNLLNLYLQDFVHDPSLNPVEGNKKLSENNYKEKTNRAIFVKKQIASNSNIANGAKSLASLYGVIFDSNSKEERTYYFEHIPASLSNAKNVARGVYKRNYKISEPLVSFNDRDIQTEIDSNIDVKIGSRSVKEQAIQEFIKKKPDFKQIKTGKSQKSRQPEFWQKIQENKAAVKKIKQEDKFDMLNTVTRQMFPESINQPLGSFESLTTEQRQQVFNEMQELGMISRSAQFSRLEDISKLISDVSNIDATAEISEKKARLLGKNKGKWKFFIPPSADDFAGLMYYMVGKGKKGDADLAWFKENLFDPFAKGINEFSTYRQFTMNQFRRMKKLLRSKNVKLKATNSTGFTNEVAVRVYVWATNGHEVPGLSEAEVKEMVNIVSNDPSLRNFAGQIINLTNFAETPAPEKSWDGGTLTTDILDYLNTSSREKFLEEYLANAEEIFGKFGQSGEIEGETANRLRAAFGDNYVEALSDVLYRMKTGRRRITGSNRLTNQFVNWINDSVGAIMFFNTRSALLQQLSFVNFVNFGDNNPLAASRAFINQPQFWSDYVSLFNSDFLKERRSGLKTDVNADEIAKAAEEGRNPIRSVIASLLKKGFLPTQIADSHAIALGGASFYRNRLNRYVKEGMTQEDAAKQAFVDFQEIAEETQQSSRPDRISMQQASGLGRLILAFANTPMQYARLTKKAALDLINRRGDWKTNLSKLMYYGAVQNIIFSSLQTALFALAFDEDEDDEKTRNRYFRIANGTADGLLRGLGFGGAAVAAGKNMVLEGIRQSKLARPDYEEVAYEALKLSPPISSKIDKLASAGRMFTYRNTREQMLNAGFTLDNPIFESAGKIISATTNLPADRVIRKLDNLSTPVRQDVETWQAVSLALGYSKWDVGLIESKAKKPQTSTTGLKKVKRKKLERKKLN